MTKKTKSDSCCIGADPEWQIKDDMRTLVRADEIRKDPKRFAAAKKAAKEELASLKKVADATASVASGAAK